MLIANTDGMNKIWTVYALPTYRKVGKARKSQDKSRVRGINVIKAKSSGFDSRLHPGWLDVSRYNFLVKVTDNPR